MQYITYIPAHYFSEVPWAEVIYVYMDADGNMPDCNNCIWLIPGTYKED